MSSLNPKTLVKLAEGEFEIFSYYLSYGKPRRLMLFLGDDATANRIANAIREAEIIAHSEGRMEAYYDYCKQDAEDRN